MKRILTLDGGGIRGVFSLKVLEKMEALLREDSGNPSMVLADHFDMFAGTSTGAIIATCLCWGMPVRAILDLYVQFGATMFTPVKWYNPIKKYLVAKYDARPLSDFLRQVFSEEDAGGKKVPALLNSKLLRKMLLVVVRNQTTGSAWPLTNNPNALYSNPALSDNNMLVPLWQIVRASTAAPIYFDPEEILLGDKRQTFVDGAVTPYNNPAMIAVQTAVLPCYNINWPTGVDQLRLISIGTMRFSALPKKAEHLWVGYYAAKVPAALIQGVAWQQDLLCRTVGQCIFGEPLDSEVGDLIGKSHPPNPWFSYARYNHTYKARELADLLLKNSKLAALDAIQAIPLLEEIGAEYAAEHVRLEHLL